MMPSTEVPDVESPLPIYDPDRPGGGAALVLERRGRMWLIWSFLLCPCHLPLTLGVLTAVLAGTSLGATLRDHVWVAGALITATWVVGTGYGFRLIRQAQRAGGACQMPRPTRSRVVDLAERISRRGRRTSR
jgi:hypothetical protein